MMLVKRLVPTLSFLGALLMGWGILSPGGNAELDDILSSVSIDEECDLIIYSFERTIAPELPLWRQYHPYVWPRRLQEQIEVFSFRQTGSGGAGFPLHQTILKFEDSCQRSAELRLIEESWIPPGFVIFCEGEGGDVHYGIAQVLIAGGPLADELEQSLKKQFPELIVIRE